MNLKLSYSLTFAILNFNNLEIQNVKSVSVFINSQILKMPDYFCLIFKVIVVFFEIIILLVHLKRFHNLSTKKKIKCISFIKKQNVPIFSLFIRVIESNVLLKYYELNIEK